MTGTTLLPLMLTYMNDGPAVISDGFNYIKMMAVMWNSAKSV